MEYKLCKPLKTKQVVPWEIYNKEQNVLEMSPLAQSAVFVKKAVECGWFEGEQPNVDELEPAQVVELAKEIWEAYTLSMGIDIKKLPSRQQTSQKG